MKNMHVVILGGCLLFVSCASVSIAAVEGIDINLPADVQDKVNQSESRETQQDAEIEEVKKRNAKDAAKKNSQSINRNTGESSMDADVIKGGGVIKK